MESFSVIVKFFRVKLRDKKRVRKMKKSYKHKKQIIKGVG